MNNLQEAEMEDLTITTQLQDVIHNNEIYLYSDINSSVALSLNKSLNIAEKNCLLIKSEFGLTEAPPIRLYINSEGGELFPALTVVDRMKNLKVPIHTYVEGMVASAATLISVSGTKRFMRKNAIMLIHQIRSFHGGTHENMKDEAKNLDVMSDIINKIYLDNSGFEVEELESLMKRDLYLDCNKCVEYKMIDTII